MDSTAIVNYLSQYMSSDLAIAVYVALGGLVWALWRALVLWASNRPTKWYWNALTKKFAVKWGDKQLARIFGRGVNDCNVKYEENLPDEAKEELKKHLIKKYPILQIGLPK